MQDIATNRASAAPIEVSPDNPCPFLRALVAGNYVGGHLVPVPELTETIGRATGKTGVEGLTARAKIFMRARTSSRLCDRQKFGKVGVRTAGLSQFRGHSGIGIATKPWRPRLRECCRQGRPAGDVETPVV